MLALRGDFASVSMNIFFNFFSFGSFSFKTNKIAKKNKIPITICNTRTYVCSLTYM